MKELSVEQMGVIHDGLSEFVGTVIKDGLKDASEDNAALVLVAPALAKAFISLAFGALIDLRRGRIALESIAKSLDNPFDLIEEGPPRHDEPEDLG